MSIWKVLEAVVTILWIFMMDYMEVDKIGIELIEFAEDLKDTKLTSLQVNLILKWLIISWFFKAALAKHCPLDIAFAIVWHFQKKVRMIISDPATISYPTLCKPLFKSHASLYRCLVVPCKSFLLSLLAYEVQYKHSCSYLDVFASLCYSIVSAYW